MIFILGEAYNREDAQNNRPFSGSSGRFLRAQLSAVGIRFEDCYATNVFNLLPEPQPGSGSNMIDVKNLCGPKVSGIPGMPALQSGKYVQLQYEPELARLRKELQSVRPTLILALGGTACWFLGLGSNLKKIRGAPVATKYGKVFPTISPSAIFRDWSQRPVFYSDLKKVAVEATFAEVRRPARSIFIEPTLDDLRLFEHEYLGPKARRLSVDIETSGKYITCIGFAPTNSVALVVPFIKADGTPYWKSAEEEHQAWLWVKRICESHPHIIGQNFLYDAHRLWRGYGIKTPGLQDDTMLLHHALYLELEKGLGFLGSVYTNEARWKYMRDSDTLKKGDE